MTKTNEFVSGDGARPVEADDLFEMANLFPRTTGLPMTVWLSPRGNARDDVRITVEMSTGDHMSPATRRSSGFGRPRASSLAACLPMIGGRFSNGYR